MATIIGTTYYPYDKRHTHFAQFVLGLCLEWGIMVGSAGMGVPAPWRDPSTASLVAASVVWVVIFDTIYAHQDLADDLRVGCQEHGHAVCGYWGGMGAPYYAITVGGCVVSVGSMIALVDLTDPASCWTWFSWGFWPTGAAIAAGLLVEHGWQRMAGDGLRL
ncbi:hypothetical protein B0T09DRAFT_368376 [Sordaria sp. MPI-SDFR-AT-0083]|nr:hypothetical protein B0T09DRAFT_368376 [Sordaria sp. MPI-SDFR-AT-0083]